jgi:Arc/MetJ-type ribon-helix-helix transcriptional regulator
MARTQLNVRVSEELERTIDEKRIELREKLGAIPTRSDILRMALEAFLGIKLAATDLDRRSTTGPAKRQASRATPSKAKTR